MPYVHRVDEIHDHEDATATGWIVAVVIIVALLALAFFAYSANWFGVRQPQTNIQIQQPPQQQTPVPNNGGSGSGGTGGSGGSGGSGGTGGSGGGSIQVPGTSPSQTTTP